MFPKKSFILIVDDDANLRDWLCMVLNDAGYANILQAKDVLSASEVLIDAESSGNHIDLVLLDWIMPGLDGLELIKIMRFNNFNPPVICFSGLDDPERIEKCEELGVVEFLSKPFTVEHLEKAMAKAWNKINS